MRATLSFLFVLTASFVLTLGLLIVATPPQPSPGEKSTADLDAVRLKKSEYLLRSRISTRNANPVLLKILSCCRVPWGTDTCVVQIDFTVSDAHGAERRSLFTVHWYADGTVEQTVAEGDDDLLLAQPQ